MPRDEEDAVVPTTPAERIGIEVVAGRARNADVVVDKHNTRHDTSTTLAWEVYRCKDIIIFVR
jgi:hypothetical protein